MTRAELKSRAKEQIKGKIGLFFLMELIILAITAACVLIPFVGWVAIFIITPAFNLSFCIIYLSLSRNEDISISHLFKGFNQTGRALWLNILISFFTSLWSLLFIIPGIIKIYSYSMAFYILADNPELTAREALRKSKEMMAGHKMDLFVLELSFIGWALLSVITFGIASIYIVPYMNATMANFYESIK